MLGFAMSVMAMVVAFLLTRSKIKLFFVWLVRIMKYCALSRDETMNCYNIYLVKIRK